jgi:hypothetical protein
MSEVYARQQERKRNAPPARDWPTTLAAIRAAGGAREKACPVQKDRQAFEDRFGGVGDER